MEEKEAITEREEEITSIKDIIGGRLHICDECDAKFKKRIHLYRHIREFHQGDRPYSCGWENCEKTFKRDSHLKRHFISHTHTKPYPCSKCIMAFGYKHHLTRHYKLIHLRTALRCLECSFFAFKKNVLKAHHKTHSLCLLENNCIQDDNTQNQLEKPTNKIQFLYKCVDRNCIAAFKRTWDLKRHIRKIHKIEIETCALINPENKIEVC